MMGRLRALAGPVVRSAPYWCRPGGRFPGATRLAVFVASERAAERVLECLRRWLHKHLDLEVNAAKSGARRTEAGALLGFPIHPGGKVSPAPKAIVRLKEGCVSSGMHGKASPASDCANSGNATSRDGGAISITPTGVAKSTPSRGGSGDTCAKASGCAGMIATDGVTRCGAWACGDARSGWPAVGAVPGSCRGISSSTKH